MHTAAGRCNRIADALSRFHWQVFQDLAPDANPRPIHLPLQLWGEFFSACLEAMSIHYISTLDWWRLLEKPMVRLNETFLTLCLFAAFLAESINHASIKVYLSTIRSLHIEI